MSAPTAQKCTKFVEEVETDQEDSSPRPGTGGSGVHPPGFIIGQPSSGERAAWQEDDKFTGVQPSAPLLKNPPAQKILAPAPTSSSQSQALSGTRRRKNLTSQKSLQDLKAPVVDEADITRVTVKLDFGDWKECEPGQQKAAAKKHTRRHLQVRSYYCILSRICTSTADCFARDAAEIGVRLRPMDLHENFAQGIKSGLVDRDMEARFAGRKYRAFKAAFQQVGFAMAVGCLAYSINAVYEKEYVRCGILAMVVAPIYLGYGIFTRMNGKAYDDLYGTKRELHLIALLSFHSLAIVLQEAVRPHPDYGLLVMHIGFVHNSTPLGEGTTHALTFFFCLVPYIIMKIVFFFRMETDGSTTPWGFYLDATNRRSSAVCDQVFKGGSGQPLFVQVLVPLIILLYQGFATMRRDASMRRDVLSSSQLRDFKDDLAREQQKCEGLLLSMLPRKIIPALQNYEAIEPQLFHDVTVIFVEICNFPFLCSELTPDAVVKVLNTIFMELDRITDQLKVYKVETVNQVYMAVAGCPEEIVNHADVAAHFALAAQECLGHLRNRINDDCGSKNDVQIQIRVGLNSGRIRAGIVGLDCPRYKLFGDTVNTASRMESTCLPGKIQVSDSTLSKLSTEIFVTQYRGEIAVKGKGKMCTSFLVGYKNPSEPGGREVAIMAINQEEVATHERFTASISQTSDVYKSPVYSRLWGLANYGCGRTSTEISQPLILSRPSRWSLHRTLRTLFLLVPNSEKKEEWMETLRRDKPIFLEDALQKRISFARNLTITWLLMLSALATIDYFMVVINTDPQRYKEAIVFRNTGTFGVGLLYLISLTSPELFRRYAQRLTIGMLCCQAIALLAAGRLIYDGEPAIIAMFGAYVLFYTVLTMFQRLLICGISTLGYVSFEVIGCGAAGAISALYNFGFLLLFFFFMACGVRLEEHLEHVSHYEQRRVARRIADVVRAKNASSQLLHSLLPPHIVQLVNEGVSPIAQHHSGVTVLFTDIKGYTAYSAQLSPNELVTFLNEMYSAFDEIIANWGLHKVEVIGDAYFVAAGCPEPVNVEERCPPEENAMRAVEVALALQRAMGVVIDDPNVQMRVGLHTGEVVAGVVGKKGPRYHLFGSTVGYAEKMESHGEPGRVHVSDKTHELLTRAGFCYTFEERLIEIEGYEVKQRTWFVNKGTSEQAFKIQRKLMAKRRQPFGLMTTPSLVGLFGNTPGPASNDMSDAHNILRSMLPAGSVTPDRMVLIGQHAS